MALGTSSQIREIVKKSVQSSRGSTIRVRTSRIQLTEGSILLGRSWMGILHGVNPYQPPLANDRSIIAINFGLLLSSRSKLVASDFAGDSASSRTGDDWPRRGGELRNSVSAHRGNDG